MNASRREYTSVAKWRAVVSELLCGAWMGILKSQLATQFTMQNNYSADIWGKGIARGPQSAPCTTHYNTLLHTTLNATCNTVQHTAIHHTECHLQHIATHGNTRHHTATHCNKMQQPAKHCNTPHSAPPATHSNTLQHSATHHTATHHTQRHVQQLSQRRDFGVDSVAKRQDIVH